MFFKRKVSSSSISVTYTCRSWIMYSLLWISPAEAEMWKLQSLLWHYKTQSIKQITWVDIVMCSWDKKRRFEIVSLPHKVHLGFSIHNKLRRTKWTLKMPLIKFWTCKPYSVKTIRTQCSVKMFKNSKGIKSWAKGKMENFNHGMFWPVKLNSMFFSREYKWIVYQRFCSCFKIQTTFFL